MRRAARRDANEDEIVTALERVGCEVFRIDWPADLLVYRAERWDVLEVKDKDGRPSKVQRERLARGQGVGITTVRTPLQALEAVGAI